LPRPMALSLRNTFRRRMRLLLTLAALSLAGAIFVGVFSTRASLMGALYDVLNLYDYHVAVYFDEPVRAQRLEMLADQVPGVTRAEAWLSVAVTRVLPDDALGETFTCLGGPVDQQTVSATMLDGRWLLPEDGQALVIANTLAEQLDVVVGDEMQLDINGRESTWQVVGVYLSAVGNQLAYTNDVALSTAAGLVGRADRVRVLIDNADSALVQDDLGQALAEQFEQAGLPVSIYQTLAEIMAANMNQFNMIIYLMLVMAALLAVVGGLGLGATMGLNVLERTREIGVMRAIGATNRITWGIVVVEGVLIGLLSWVIGTLLSYPVGCLLNGAVGSAFLGVLTGYAFSYPGVVVWLVVVVIVSIIASLAPARRASRISVREALTYE